MKNRDVYLILFCSLVIFFLDTDEFYFLQNEYRPDLWMKGPIELNQSFLIKNLFVKFKGKYLLIFICRNSQMFLLLQ